MIHQNEADNHSKCVVEIKHEFYATRPLRPFLFGLKLTSGPLNTGSACCGVGGNHRGNHWTSNLYRMDLTQFDPIYVN